MSLNNLFEPLPEFMVDIFNSREAGESFASIGRRHGLSTTTAKKKYEFVRLLELNTLPDSTQKFLDAEIKSLKGHIYVRLYYCLLNAKILRIRDVMSLTRNDLMAIPYIGRKSINILEEYLDHYGLKLPQDPPTPPQKWEQVCCPRCEGKGTITRLVSR